MLNKYLFQGGGLLHKQQTTL